MPVLDVLKGMAGGSCRSDLCRADPSVNSGLVHPRGDLLVPWGVVSGADQRTVQAGEVTFGGAGRRRGQDSGPRCWCLGVQH